MLLICYFVHLSLSAHILRYYGQTKTLEYWTNTKDTYKLSNKTGHIPYDTLIDKVIADEVYAIMTYRNIEIGNYSLTLDKKSMPLSIQQNTQVNSQCRVDNVLNLMKNTNAFSIVYATYGICDSSLILSNINITNSTYRTHQLHQAQKIYIHHKDYLMNATQNMTYRVIWPNKQQTFGGYTLIYTGEYVSQHLVYPQRALISEIVREPKLSLIPDNSDKTTVRMIHIFQELNNREYLKIITECAPRNSYLLFVPSGRQAILSGTSPTDCISLLFPNKIIWMLAEQCQTYFVSQNIVQVLFKRNERETEVIILRKPLCSSKICYGKEHSVNYASLMNQLERKLPESVLTGFRRQADRLETGATIEWQLFAKKKMEFKFIENLHVGVAETEKKLEDMYRQADNFWEGIDGYLKEQVMLHTELASMLWGCFLCFVVGSVVWWLRHVEKSKK